MAGFTYPAVDLLVTVTGCHIDAKIGEFSTHTSVPPQNLGHPCVDFETNSAGCFAKTFSFLLGILVHTG